MTDDIFLTDHLERLLRTLAEAQATTPDGVFTVSYPEGRRPAIEHPGLDRRLTIDFGDVDEFVRQDLLAPTGEAERYALTERARTYLQRAETSTQDPDETAPE